MSEENTSMELEEKTENISNLNISLIDISKTISYIERGVELSQPRLLQRAIRQNVPLRRGIQKELLLQTIKKFIPSFNLSYQIIENAIQKLPSTNNLNNDNEEIIPPTNDAIPEVEVYIFTLVITTLLRYQLNEDAAIFSSHLIERIRKFSRRTLDLFSSKAFFYFSLSYENIGRLEVIRPVLLNLYRTSCLHHDEIGQAVLLNLILRNYLHYNLIQAANTFASKITFPENASNNQFCRYLYSMGRIQAIQLEYSDAYLKLTMAARKAPQETARGFNLTVQKLIIIVQLLMGDIPERSIFNAPETRNLLKPYLALTQAVRTGDLHEFSQVCEKYRETFLADKNLTLILRLGHNVLKIGLRKISVSYSRISLADVANKLQLSSARAAEYVCARAIKDGVIEATIDHENGWLASNDRADVYSTEEPQKAFHRRIVFCLDVHNEAVKAMTYPPDAYKKELAGKGKADDEKSIEELIKEMEDDMEDL